MTLPLKVRILEYVISSDKPVTINDLMMNLEHEYKGERQFNKKRVREYVETFIGIKFFEMEKVEYDSNGELDMYIYATDYGKSREKYIYGHY